MAAGSAVVVGEEKFDKRRFEEKFHPPEELERSRSKRVEELEVLLGEMDSLSRGARIYQGTSGAPGAVFLLSRDRTAAKSAVKKEIRDLIQWQNFDLKIGFE